MATATKKVHPAKPAARGARAASESASLRFLVYSDNGGDYHWEIADDGGKSHGGCGGFASYEDAERAARRVHDGAGSARFEPEAAEARRRRAM
jgi:hypothetical protein